MNIQKIISAKLLKLCYICFIFHTLVYISCNKDIEVSSSVARAPQISPSYAGLIIPPNIAPLNFAIEEAATQYYIEIGEINQNPTIHYLQKDSIVKINQKHWRKLLQQAKGGVIYFRIYLKRDNKWIQMADILNVVANQEIDQYLVYRLLYPGYELWNEMGIYQRELSSYKQIPIVENKSLEGSCVNCHTFANNSPETMLLHIRGELGGTILYRDGKTSKTDMTVGGMNNRGTYSSWHPDQQHIAFSMNDVQQYFHFSGSKPIEVADKTSDLAIYDCQTNEIFTSPKISGEEQLETYPSWHPNGRVLYFCRAKKLNKNMPLDSILYDLYSVEIDVKSRTFGDPQCVYEASALGKSVSFPRVSPDGRHLMLTLSDYGCFPIWHPESELALLDISSNSLRILEEVNSDDVESFHSWSSSGDWFVFSSKRLDGLWARPFIAHFDKKTGLAGKPFILPQKDPYFYDNFTKTYNLPELITRPVKNVDFRKP
ncbi:cytochrome c biosynthesis protein [Bacteroidales bacterium]|nr:cytochrome c biosynthesis protein [Bacteroidales bacterium]